MWNATSALENPKLGKNFHIPDREKDGLPPPLLMGEPSPFSKRWVSLTIVYACRCIPGITDKEMIRIDAMFNLIQIKRFILHSPKKNWWQWLPCCCCCSVSSTCRRPQSLLSAIVVDGGTWHLDTTGGIWKIRAMLFWFSTNADSAVVIAVRRLMLSPNGEWKFAHKFW